MIRPDYRQIKHSNELYHYGIPRRSGRYPWGSGKKPYQGDDVHKDHTLSKGTNLYRVSVGKDNIKSDTSKERSGSTYVSYDPRDRTMYRGIYVGQLASQNKNYKKSDPIREAQYTLKKDLKVAGRDSVRRAVEKNISLYDTCVSLTEHYINENKDKLVTQHGKISNRYNDLEFDEYVSTVSESYLKRRLKDIKEGGADLEYHEKAWVMGFDETARNKVINELKKQGYDAMSDESGIGGTGGSPKQGVDPLIIFDSSNSTMSYKKSKGIAPGGLRYKKDFKTGLKYYNEMNEKK